MQPFFLNEENDQYVLNGPLSYKRNFLVFWMNVAVFKWMCLSLLLRIYMSVYV